jgi:4-hydroxybutyrate dehydrogenase
MPFSAMSFPTRVVFGAGCVRELPAELERIGAQRPLIVVDRGIVGAGIARRVSDVLENAGVRHQIFERVDPNPVEKNVWDGVEAYKSAGCDSIVGLGGGSPLDVAKIIALMIHHPQPISRYDDATGGDRYVTPNVPPIIAIPTTAGTGSEVGRSGVIILDDTKRKTVIFSPYLLAKAALLDPELTLGLPPFITAATGIDALTHNIEAYIAKGNHPYADAMAIAGMTRVAKYLVRAVKNGQTDIEAREQMLIASSMGAIAFQKGLGAAHSLAHALSPVAGMHHGHANALVLPAVLAFNREAAQPRLADVAVAMGFDARASVAEKAAGAVELVTALKLESGLTGGLSQHGVKEDMIPALISKSVEDACHQSNPRACTADDFRALIKAAW